MPDAVRPRVQTFPRRAAPVQGSEEPSTALADTIDKSDYQGGRTDADMVAVGETVDLRQLARRAQESVRDATSPNTVRAYEGDLRRFAAWCTANGLPAIPASDATLVLYLRYLGDAIGPRSEQPHRVSTIDRALAAICSAHVRAGHHSPWTDGPVQEMRDALRREKGVRPSKKTAADDAILRRMLAVLPQTLLGLRDRSLLTLAWAMAARRSEVVSLDVADVRREAKGLVLMLRSSKTDQQKRGREIPIWYSNAAECCPVRSLDAWLSAAGITEGPLFRRLGRDGRVGARLTAASVADRVKRWAKVAGLAWKEFAGHSLRSGFVTTAVRNRKSPAAIMVVTGHVSEDSLRGYYQSQSIFEGGAGEGLL